jgi:hypothetical protein
MQKLATFCFVFIAVACFYANSVSAIQCWSCADPKDADCKNVTKIDCDKTDDGCLTTTTTQDKKDVITKGCGEYNGKHIILF